MRVLVFEAGGGGHIFNYDRLLLPAVTAVADEVVVVLTVGALETDSWQAQLRAMPPSIRWDASVPPRRGPHLKRQLSTRQALLAAIKKHRPDHIYVPTADTVSYVMGFARAAGRRDIPPGVEVEAALHRCGFAYPVESRSRRARYRLGYWAHTCAPWTRLFNVDVIAYEWIRRHGGPIAERSFLLPDPVEIPPPVSTLDARRKLNLPEDGQFIGCVGAIDARKGCHWLLKAFRQPSVPASARLLLAGGHDELIKQILRTEFAELVRNGRIVSIDRYLDMGELHYALAAIDLVCTPCDGQIAISSTALRAAAAGRPVLATDFGWCGRMVDAFGMGWNCNVKNPAEFAHAIVERLEQAKQWQPTEACRRLLQFHATENFVAVFTQRLRQRLNLPPLAGTIGWDEVQAPTVELPG